MGPDGDGCVVACNSLASRALKRAIWGLDNGGETAVHADRAAAVKDIGNSHFNEERIAACGLIGI